MPKLLRLVCLALLLVSLPQLASAQSPATAKLTTPNSDTFPVISTFLEVYDDQGHFVSGLVPKDITVLEDEQRLPATALEELQPGAQFVVAINPGVTFSIRDVQGLTRYDYLVNALETWANQHNSSIDDLSLLSSSGNNELHLKSSQSWLAGLKELPTDHRNAAPNLQVLSQAISVAADPLNEELNLKGRGILLITPNPEQNALPAFENMTALAKQAQVRIFVWMVSSESYFTTTGAQVLQQMAQETGGRFFAFSGVEPIPDLETYLEPLRRRYILEYESSLISSGEHQLAVEIANGSFQVTSQPASFNLDVLPPNPMFVSPPAQIFRPLENTSQKEGGGAVQHNQQIEILVEYPDGFERSLMRTTLYVDGIIVAENTQPPFDVFTWDLNPYTESSRHTLQVEVVDMLGLSSVSMEQPVDITVQRQLQGVAMTISRNSSIVAAVSVIMAGAILILVIFLIVRKQQRQTSTLEKTNGNLRKNDPVFQEVSESSEPANVRPRLAGWASQLQNRLHWPQRSGQEEPIAYLEWLLEPGDYELLTPVKPIPINGAEITLGIDPEQATLVLEDPSVEGLHARLERQDDGSFTLRDYGGVAGTWINFAPVQERGALLEHGDLIHIGRTCFRFKIPGQEKNHTPVITFNEG